MLQSSPCRRYVDSFEISAVALQQGYARCLYYSTKLEFHL